MPTNNLQTEESVGTESINDRIDRLNTLSRRDEASNCKRALSLAEKALSLSKECGYEKGWANSLVSMGMAYARMSQFDKSIISIFEAIPMLQKLGEKQDEVRALNLAGTNHYFYGRIEESLDYFNRSMSLASEIGFERMVGAISNNIGELYNEMNKSDEAMEYYKHGLATALKVKDMLLKATSLSNMGQVSFKLGHNPDALKYFRQGLVIFRKINDKIYVADTLNKVGEVYRRLGLVKKAMDCYKSSLQIFEEQNERYYQTDVYINLGLLYMDNNQYDRSEENFGTALAIAEEISAKKKIYVIHNHLSNLYEKMGNCQKALYHYRLHHKIERDVSGEELERQLYVAKSQYQIEQAQKQAEIIRLKNIELRKKADEIERKAQELEESYKNINVISEIGQKITSTFNFPRIANTVYRSLNSLMDAACFAIALYNDFEKTIEVKVCIEGTKKLDVRPISMNDPNSMFAWCIKNCKDLCLNDFETEHTRYIPKNERAGNPDEPKSVMYCPLVFEKKVIGIITIQSYRKNAYTQNNINTMKALASYIAIALNNYLKSQEIKEKAAELAAVNSRLSVEISKRKTAQNNLEEVNKKLKDLLSMDALTGIFNRRGFEQFLRLEWRRSVRESIPLSIILIDIDFFKEYNDRFGHLAGDNCLKKVSNSLLNVIKRPMDFLARYGGEEFIVILPSTEASGALTMAEAMRQSVEEMKIVHGRSNVSPYITISLGVSTIVPTRKSSQKEFINGADQALYKAKQEGRNRVCAAWLHQE